MGVAEYFAVYLMADRLSGYQIPFPITIKARRAKHMTQRRPYAFAGHLDQPDLGYGQHIRFASIPLQCFTQGVIDFFLVGALLHINKIDDDNPAQIPQTNLVGYFLNRLQIGL